MSSTRITRPILTRQQALDVSAYLTSLGRPADFTKTNQLRVLLNHLWLKTVVGLGGWMSDLKDEPTVEHAE